MNDPLIDELHLIQAASLTLPPTPHPWSDVENQAQEPLVTPPDDLSDVAWREAAHQVVDRHDLALGHHGRPSGVIYTPRTLAEGMVTWALSALDPRSPNANRPVRVLEPGCGAGRLLIPIVGALLNRGVAPKAVLRAVMAEEIDEAAAAVARRVVWLAMGGRVDWPLNPDPIAVVDSLAPARIERGGFDAVIGNPPYVFGQALRESLRPHLKRFELARRTSPDLFRLFIEATLPRVRPGGVHALLVPDALLARDALADVRAWLTARADVIGIGRCERPFQATTRDGRRRAVATGAAFVLGRPCATPERRSVLVRRWTGARFDDGRRLPAEAVPTAGEPWAVAAPAWWFGAGGLRARLESAATVRDVLQRGTAGATRGEEIGRSALNTLEGHRPVLTGREVGRMAVHPARVGIAPDAVRKPKAIYAGPRVLLVKTGSTPVAAADPGCSVVLQSLYVLHTRADSPWDPWTLAATLASAWLGCYALFRWTAVKSVQPQMTLGNVRSLPLPARLDFVALGLIARRLHQLNPGDPERVALERQCDALVGQGFGLDLKTWAPRLSEALAPLPASQRPAWCSHSATH